MRTILYIAAIFVSALIIVIGGPLESLADNTLRKRPLKVTVDAKESMRKTPRPAVVFDTLRNPSRDSIAASGYDKPLRTNRETVLITNSTSRRVGGVAVTLDYFDMQGRQLHSRTDTLPADIPAGETRMLRMSTWDQQHSYYYHRGQIPRTANVTPYDVKCRFDFILLSD